MSKILITVFQKGAQVKGIDKAIQKLVKDKYPEAKITVENKETPDSRSARFSEAIGFVEDGKSAIEELRDELQEWYDNLPDNFQSGQKGDELQEAIDALEEAINNLDEVTSNDVNFPGMY